MSKRIYKIEDGKKICGVCGGLAEYFDVDPTIVRLIFVVAGLAGTGAAVIGYIIAALIMPDKSDVQKEEEQKKNEAREEETENK